MKRRLLFSLLFAVAFALVFSAIPAKAGTLYNFSFAGPTAMDYYGNGTMDVNTEGVISSLTGTLYFEAANEGSMTLLDVGTFASNDNVFAGAPNFVTQNGFSFISGPGTMSYNIYYAATTDNYAFIGCAVGGDCITHDSYGNPSSPVNFTASAAAPEPAVASLIGIGLIGFSFVRRRTRK